jgi:hypothetical protein|tara:strand:- start:8719 stop:9609 length:891 start_codon:yes stop_codon:yes gene_type:complete
MRNYYIRDNVRSEQNLYEDIVIESLKIYGQDVYYLPRETVYEDRVFGDEVPAKYNNSYKIEMYIDNTEGFDGEGDLFTRFGVEIRDEATFVVSRRRWAQTIGGDNNINSERPREGDLIFLPLSNSMFQITHVEHEMPFYQLANLPTYKCRAQLFDYNSEDFDTGIEEIQDIEQDHAYTYLLKILGANINNTKPIFTDTIITQNQSGVLVTAEVAKYSDSDGTIHAVNFSSADGTFRLFHADSTVTVDSASNIHTLQTVSELNKLSENEQNTDFGSFGDDFLDFSEGNPFGDPSGND